MRRLFTSKRSLWYLAALIIFSALITFGSCSRRSTTRTSTQGGTAEAATLTYVAPGDMDEYYIFYSGGHSGNVYIGGVPSMRHIATIPVFAPYPATGYGFDKETKEMLGGYTWGDAHHPALSETQGDYDGRWLFVNDNGNNRIARIDLRDFKTKQILGPVPNISGFHGGSGSVVLWQRTRLPRTGQLRCGPPSPKLQYCHRLLPQAWHSLTPSEEIGRAHV